jgi:very-long-chain (3R)-3-hydroxyacyl-CoA dehydratase
MNETTRTRYLSAYNTFALIAWLFYMSMVAGRSFVLDTDSRLMLSIAQGVALLEVLHAAMGWAGGSWWLTALQVASRILVVVLMNLLPLDLLASGIGYYGTVMVSVAWGITEVVRYAYYRQNMRGATFGHLEWARYSLFIFLYPLGVTGEFMIMYAFVNQHGFGLNSLSIAFSVIAVLYAVFFPKLYGYMWSQRKKKLVQSL